MVARYYAQFLLHPGDAGSAEEYSGVLEVESEAAHEVLDPAEIERLLKRTLGLAKRDVELIDWSRLH